MIELHELKDIPYINGGFYYLASPYGHEDRMIIVERMWIYEKVDAKLSSLGHFVMSPLDKHYKLQHELLPGDYKYWANYCKTMLRLCKGLIVICSPGWDTSVGVQDEISEAKKIGIPIYYVNVPSL